MLRLRREQNHNDSGKGEGQGAIGPRGANPDQLHYNDCEERARRIDCRRQIVRDGGPVPVRLSGRARRIDKQHQPIECARKADQRPGSLVCEQLPRRRLARQGCQRAYCVRARVRTRRRSDAQVAGSPWREATAVRLEDRAQSGLLHADADCRAAVRGEPPSFASRTWPRNKPPVVACQPRRRVITQFGRFLRSLRR